MAANTLLVALGAFSLFNGFSALWNMRRIARLKEQLAIASRDIKYQSDLLVALQEERGSKDETIASLTAQRDRLSRDVSSLVAGHTRDKRNEAIIAGWNSRNARMPFQSVEDALSKAYTHGPDGRLTRLVPKVPTNG